MFVSDIAIFVLKRDVKLQLTNLHYVITLLNSSNTLRSTNQLLNYSQFSTKYCKRSFTYLAKQCGNDYIL